MSIVGDPHYYVEVRADDRAGQYPGLLLLPCRKRRGKGKKKPIIIAKLPERSASRTNGRETIALELSFWLLTGARK
jgi:hypothetical protein